MHLDTATGQCGESRPLLDSVQKKDAFFMASLSVTPTTPCIFTQSSPLLPLLHLIPLPLAHPLLHRLTLHLLLPLFQLLHLLLSTPAIFFPPSHLPIPFTSTTDVTGPNFYRFRFRF